MVATTLNGVMLTGNHASRPAANTVAKGALYACSTHTKVYQSDASSWSDWYTAAAAGGSSGITRTQLGTTSLGASFDTTNKAVYKKVTAASAGLIESIAVGIKGNSSGTFNLAVGVMSDNAGTPLNVIATSIPTRTTAGSSNVTIGMAVINSTARFVVVPVGLWVASGDYWLVAISNSNAGTDLQLAYSSGTGSDRTKATTDGIYDHSVGASSTGSNDFSIFANFLT